MKEWTENKLWLFRLDYLVGIFSKILINEVSLSLQGQQWTVFVVNDKIQTLKQQSEF